MFSLYKEEDFVDQGSKKIYFCKNMIDRDERRTKRERKNGKKLRII